MGKLTEIETLAELAQLALDDADNLAASDEYVMDSDIWHELRHEDNRRQCHVCWAGAVMSRTLGMHIQASANPSIDSQVIIDADLKQHKLDPADADRLCALDLLRTQQFRQAFRTFGYQVGEADDLSDGLYHRMNEKGLSLVMDGDFHGDEEYRRFASDMRRILPLMAQAEAKLAEAGGA